VFVFVVVVVFVFVFVAAAIEGHLMYYRNVIAGVRTVDNRCLILTGGDFFANVKAGKRQQ
jgi:hypothetical protein